MAQHLLEIRTGKHKGRRVKLKDVETIIGRDETARIRIGSKEVSRQHCVIRVKEDGLFIQDLGSSNGTFVNGRPISGEWWLQANDTVTVGPMNLLVVGSRTETDDGAQVSVGAAQSDSQRLSDDDIATLLGEDLPPDQAASDTTVIRAGTIPPGPEPAAEADDLPPPAKLDFASVAEEAQDIIRRHRERQASQQNEQA